MKTKLIIDCDPGHDDALALILAHRCAEVVGISTVSGNAPLEAVTTNALKIVELLGVETPVYRGAAGPLVAPDDGEGRHAAVVHGVDGLGGTRLPEPTRTVAGSDAPGFLLEASHRHEGLWLAAIGPLTNVALAIQRDPGLAQRLAGISIMGGSTGGGNVTAAAEFNIWADPEAADVVFRSGALIRMCGLNLTHQFRTTDALIDPLRTGTSQLGHFAADVLTYLHDRMQHLIGMRAAAMHDPCAILAVTDPELLRFEARPIAVELGGELTRGMTVVDERGGGGANDVRRGANDVRGGANDVRDSADNIHVGYTIDADAALERLLSALDSE